MVTMECGSRRTCPNLTLVQQECMEKLMRVTVEQFRSVYNSFVSFLGLDSVNQFSSSFERGYSNNRVKSFVVLIYLSGIKERASSSC